METEIKYLYIYARRENSVTLLHLIAFTEEDEI